MRVLFGSHCTLSPRFSKEAGAFGWMEHAHIRPGMALQQNDREALFVCMLRNSRNGLKGWHDDF